MCVFLPHSTHFRQQCRNETRKEMCKTFKVFWPLLISRFGACNNNLGSLCQISVGEHGCTSTTVYSLPPNNRYTKRSNVQWVGVTRPSYCFVADPLQAGGALSLYQTFVWWRGCHRWWVFLLNRFDFMWLLQSMVAGSLGISILCHLYVWCTDHCHVLSQCRWN